MADFEYFPSGSNQAGQIAALVSLGYNVGVAANELRPGGEAELAAMADTEQLLFIDSGAFGEVEFPEDGPPCVKLDKKGRTMEITDAEWDDRIGLCERLAPALGAQLYVVAPDRVGCQQTTLARLARYADRMRALAAQGVNVIVPLQRGELSTLDFDAACGEILQIENYVRGIPLKKKATTWEGYMELAAGLPAGARVHLLGQGPGSQAIKDQDGNRHGFEDFLAAVAHLEVTCDSVAIRRLVGRHNGPGGGPRILTIVQDRVRAELGLAPAYGPNKARLEGDDAYRVQYMAVREVFGELPGLAGLRRLQLSLAA